MVKEAWRKVVTYNGFYSDSYEVSNKGRVRSVDRITYTNRGDGYHNNRKGRMLAQNNDKDGYPKVILSKNAKTKTPFVHRLVAEAFIENPKNKPVINHINEVKDDNRAENIEWCTVAYNNVYNDRAIKSAEKQKKPVIATNEKTGKETYFESISITEESGFDMGHVTACAKGRRNRHLGHTWRYANKGEIVNE